MHQDLSDRLQCQIVHIIGVLHCSRAACYNIGNKKTFRVFRGLGEVEANGSISHNQVEMCEEELMSDS